MTDEQRAKGLVRMEANCGLRTLAGTKRQRWAWWFVAGYCVLIFIASSIPGREIPGGLGSDKLHHTLEYVPLGGLLMYALLLSTHWRWPAVFVVAFALGSLYGVTDELHQMVTPRRDPSTFDALADAIGTSIGAAGVACVALVRRRG